MTGQGATQWVRLDRTLTERLRDIARSADVTLSMLTMAVYAAMIAATTGSASTVLGVPVRGRLASELEPVMGFFNNLLPLQLEVDRQCGIIGLTQAIKHDLLEAFSHQDVPFERLAAEPELACRSQGAGLYQALFSFQDARERTRRWGGLDQTSILLFQKGATEDLGLWLMEVPGGVEGGLTYNADLYTEQTAIALRDRYLELLERLAREPAVSVEALTAVAGSAAGQSLRRLAADPAEAIRTDGPDGPVAQPVSPLERSQAARPSTPEEGALAGIWASLLDIPATQIRLDDNFFDLGGDSLLAMRAIEEWRRVTGSRVEARRYIFESLAQLASPQAAADRDAAAADRNVAAAEPSGVTPPRNRLARLIASFSRKERARAR